MGVVKISVVSRGWKVGMSRRTWDFQGREIIVILYWWIHVIYFCPDP
jgi:hypothetical protein